jgi:hypothetical protein
VFLEIADLCACRKVNCKDRSKDRIPDLRGKITVCGRLLFEAGRYEFEESYLIDLIGKPIAVFFRTKTSNGTRYEFAGSYPDDEHGLLPLKGKITKIVDGRAVSESGIVFSPYRIIE